MNIINNMNIIKNINNIINNINNMGNDINNNISNKNRFIHFDTREECDDFVSFIGTDKITHKCCYGQGCGIIDSEIELVYELRKQFNSPENRKERHKNRIKKKEEIQEIEEDDNIDCTTECCVCFERTNTYTKCGHLLCTECSLQLIKKECPYCRTKNEVLL
jgi:hypothetical protein